jgi:hypothetical protein
MKIAILISGHCRTFVYQEQRIFFERFIKYLSQFGQCDTYLMLKTDHLMQTEQGLRNLKQIIKTLKPIYSIAFKQWSQNDENCYYSQMKMIRHLINASNHDHYDYYIRIRPDTVIPNLNEINFNHQIYSSRKFDAKANDQFFVMSRQIVNEWFLNLPIFRANTSPEYIIFNSIRIPQLIRSGIVRKYKRISSWNFYHCHLNIKDYWLPEQSFVSISNEQFINKLKTIMHYQEVI